MSKRLQNGADRWGERGSAGVSFAASLTFLNISHAFGAVEALKDVSLDVQSGEILCLLGQSGCGKTTLLRITAGIEVQTSGRLLLNGIEVSGPDRFIPPEERNIGLVFQDYALFPHLNVLKNVTFGLRKLPPDEARKAAMTALSRVGLDHYTDKYPHMLSGGQQQRVALARAIAPRPAVLLMDEPFSGLDNNLRDKVRAETLAVLRETRTTSIFVTHDPEEAMRVADRIALLREGHLIQVGTPDDLYRKPADMETAKFFGQVNVLTGTVESGYVKTPLGRFPAPHFSNGENVDVCIRPQGVMPDSRGNGLEGRVISRQFLGELDLLELAVEGLDVPLIARLPAEASPRERDVGIRFEESAVLVFPRKDAIS